jgi:hypothetical protein
VEFVQRVPGTLAVTFEEGTCTAWLHDLLKPQVSRVVVCGPRKNALLKVDEAERFFKSAVEMKQSGVDKGLSLRNYGGFLLRQGRREEGMDSFRESIAAFAGVGDRFTYYRVDTYFRFADQMYLSTREIDEATALFEKAKMNSQL